MEAKREENFQLRGKDSWIHCLEFVRQKPIRTPYHFHGYVELLYFFEGNGILWVSGVKQKIAPRDAVCRRCPKSPRFGNSPWLPVYLREAAAGDPVCRWG